MEGFSEKIQDSELEVMQVLWGCPQPMALIDIRHALASHCSWEDSTIKTLLKRLCNKGAVALVRRGVYRAVVTEQEYSRLENERYISKVFHGSAKNLVASLLSDGKLSEEDMEELVAMLRKGGGDE